MGISTHKPPARLLDVTRLVSRAGRQPTGVDRVELAYLDHFLAQPEPLWLLCKSRVGVWLVSAEGGAALSRAFADGIWTGCGAKAGRAVLRPYRTARAPRAGLRRMVARHLPKGSAYYNTGHSHLSDRSLRALRAAGMRLSVLIHDTIPLDLPELQREGTVERFRTRFTSACRHADRLIANSAQTARDIARHGRDLPPIVTAPLGVTLPKAGAWPDALDPTRPV